jgi:hypothetical protein
MRNFHATARSLRAALAAGAAVACLSGCIADRTAGGTGVGNPAKGSVTVAMVAVDSAPAAKAAAKTAALARNPDGSFDIRDAGGSVFTVRTGYANVGRIKIALPDGIGCSEADETACESGEARIDGPWVSDLMTGKWLPDPGAVRIPAGAYKRLEVRLEAQQMAGAGAPDLGYHSLVFGGTFAWSGRADRPFTVALDFDEDERFESPTGFPVAEGSTSIIIALDIARWLSQANLTACLENGSLPLDSAGGFALGKDGGCGVGQELKDAIKASGSVRSEYDGGKGG